MNMTLAKPLLRAPAEKKLATLEVGPAVSHKSSMSSRLSLKPRRASGPAKATFTPQFFTTYTQADLNLKQGAFNMHAVRSRRKRSPGAVCTAAIDPKTCAWAPKGAAARQLQDVGGQGTTGGTDVQGGISNQLATLVPSFDPSKDDLQIFQQKVQLVFSVWPQNGISELVTRLILNTSGSAFAKLQLHHTELSNNEAKSVQKLIEYLGGQWGKTGLEKRYFDAERALFQCSQQTDESHDSYLARADVLWSKLKSQKLQLDDLQA
eukprot:s4527_g1.t1